MSDFISNLHINAFRGIKGLTIGNLSTVNVLVGANNSGKTSVLESILFLSSPTDIGKITNMAFQRAPLVRAKRESQLVDFFSTLFQKQLDEDVNEPNHFHYSIDLSASVSKNNFSFSSSGTIENEFNTIGEESKAFLFSTKIQTNDQKPLYREFRIPTSETEIQQIKSASSSFYRSLYVNSGVSYYNVCVNLMSNAILQYDKADLLAVIQSFDSTIQDVSIVDDCIYIHNSLSGTLPLYAYGTGLQKAALFSVIMSVMPDGIILIDEIDNAINMSAFSDVFPWFVKKCKERNIQAFVTTHSAEAIDSVLNSGLDNDIRIITLRKTPKTHKTVAKVRTGSEALSDRENFKMELRV